jgi:hypothetical protein
VLADGVNSGGFFNQRDALVPPPAFFTGHDVYLEGAAQKLCPQQFGAAPFSIVLDRGYWRLFDPNTLEG